MNRRLYNKGLSYLELVLVMAVMALVVSFSTITINTVYNNNVSRSADTMYSALNKARNTAMTRGTKYGWITFINKDNVVYYRIGEKVPYYADGKYFEKYSDWKKVAPSAVKVRFGTYSLDNGEVNELSFKQSTGDCRGIYNPESEAGGVSMNPVISDSILVQLERSGSGKNNHKIRVNEIGGSVVRE